MAIGSARREWARGRDDTEIKAGRMVFRSARPEWAPAFVTLMIVGLLWVVVFYIPGPLLVPKDWPVEYRGDLGTMMVDMMTLRLSARRRSTVMRASRLWPGPAVMDEARAGYLYAVAAMTNRLVASSHGYYVHTSGHCATRPSLIAQREDGEIRLHWRTC